MKHCHALCLLLGLGVQAERHMLNCCKFAKFSGRDYERTGTMYLGGENGTEVPMYTSVGNADNGGNMVSVNWNTAEDEDGNLVAWPSINEAKMEDIGAGSPMMIMEEIGLATERRPTAGGLKCPDKLDFHDVNKEPVPWTCDEEKIEECADQLETCPSVAVQNRCQTLAQICCSTCKIYFANRTAELELEREKAAEEAAANSFSIGSSMTMKPAEPAREVEINGGALAGSFEVAKVDDNDSTEESNETSPPAENETEVEEEKSEPEPEPEGGSAILAFCTVLSVILL